MQPKLNLTQVQEFTFKYKNLAGEFSGWIAFGIA
jgi:hypothetical protein